MKKAVILLTLVLSLTVGITACKKQEQQLGAITTPPPLTEFGEVKAAETYSVDDAQGVYGFIEEDGVRASFMGLQNYNPIAKELEKLDEGQKAIVIGIALENIEYDSKVKTNAIKCFLYDASTKVQYKAAWDKDNDIEQFSKSRSGDVLCFRAIYVVPEQTNPENCIALIEINGKSAWFSNIRPDETREGAATDYSNMCPICQAEEHDKTELVSCRCEYCGRTFICAHAPQQRICFRCSVLNNYCTQCLRYIDKSVANTEGE